MVDLLQHPAVDLPPHGLLQVGSHHEGVVTTGVGCDQLGVVLEQHVAGQALGPIPTGHRVRPVPRWDDRRQCERTQQALLILGVAHPVECSLRRPHPFDGVHGATLNLDLDQPGVQLNHVDEEHTDTELFLWCPDLRVLHAHGISLLVHEPTALLLVDLELVLRCTGQHGLQPQPISQGHGQRMVLGYLAQLIQYHPHRHCCHLVRRQLQQWAHVGVATASLTVAHVVAVLT